MTTVANTILQQLGGGQFMVMTGSKNPIALDNGLRLDLSKNKAGVNRLEIRLNGLDLYDIKFYAIRKNTKAFLSGKSSEPFVISKVVEFSDYYFDQLQDTFEEVTGLYTTLMPRR